MGTGPDWRKRREELGKTLEQASLELRISQRYLRGIEEGNYSRWPAKVFSTGFIRAYAKYLSLDPEPVLSEYYEFLGMHQVEEPPLQTRPEWLERERLRGSRRATYRMAAGAVLAIGVFLVWYGRYTAERPPVGPEKRESSRAPSVAGREYGKDASLPQGSVGVGDNAASESYPAAGQKTVTAVGGSGPITAPYQLFLEASDLTWIMYSRDGTEPVDVMLYPGDRLSIQAQEKIYLKLGNAGGVVGTLNGSLLPAFGQKGQVKEITLGE